MPVTRRSLVLAAVAFLALAFGVAGCAKPAAVVTSAWPTAAKERSVPEPPAPPRWPYTGQDAKSAKDVSRRPLQVKIENSPSARPQIGLNSADVVYETITEGGITRFNCVFHSSIPKTIGPVRSARLSDLWIVPQYGGLFFFSGASSTVNHKVNAAKLPNLSEDAGISFPYWRSTERSAPHNLMLDTAKAYTEAKKRGFATTAKLEGLQYDRRSREATPATNRIEIPFSQANTVRWEYDRDSRMYARWNNGNVHKDGATGKQVTATNVVVMWVKYKVASHDKVGSTTYDVNLGGTGRATIFRDGGRIDCTWSADRDSVPRFKTADGAVVKLSRGRTWFQVIPLDGRITMK